MLHNVPSHISNMTRHVVLKHPNSMRAVLYRKKLLRPDDKHASAPAMGGMAVISSTDEEQFEYERLGPCGVLPAEQFQPSPMVKAGDANIGPEDEFRFMIEAEQPSGHPEWFMPKTHDIFYILLAGDEDGPMIAFEIVSIETTSNIPPFTQRFVCNRRDDLFID